MTQDWNLMSDKEPKPDGQDEDERKRPRDTKRDIGEKQTFKRRGVEKRG